MTTDNESASPVATKTAATPGKSAAPIIVDLGKKDRKAIRRLRKGRPGKLMRRIEETIAHLHENGALTEGAQPIIIVVRERPQRKSRQIAKLWGLT